MTPKSMKHYLTYGNFTFSKSCSFEFVTMVRIQVGHPLNRVAGLSFGGSIKCPLFPDITWSTIALTTTSASVISSLNPGVSIKAWISGVLVQDGLTKLSIRQQIVKFNKRPPHGFLLRGPNFRRLVPSPQFACQSLMKCHRTSFRTRIIHVLSKSDIRCHTGNSHHMTMILLSHSGHEFSNHPEMRNSVHFENFYYTIFISVEYCFAVADTSIIYQDCWIPVVLADFCCCRGNLRN